MALSPPARHGRSMCRSTNPCHQARSSKQSCWMSAPSDLLFTCARRRSDAPVRAATQPPSGADDVLSTSALLALAVGTAHAISLTPATTGSPSPTLEPAAKARINPTKRVLRFVVPLTDDGNYLGDVDLAVDPQDRLSVKAERLLQILEP